MGSLISDSTIIDGVASSQDGIFASMSFLVDDIPSAFYSAIDDVAAPFISAAVAIAGIAFITSTRAASSEDQSFGGDRAVDVSGSVPGLALMLSSWARCCSLVLLMGVLLSPQVALLLVRIDLFWSDRTVDVSGYVPGATLSAPIFGC